MSTLYMRAALPVTLTNLGVLDSLPWVSNTFSGPGPFSQGHAAIPKVVAIKRNAQFDYVADVIYRDPQPTKCPVYFIHIDGSCRGLWIDSAGMLVFVNPDMQHQTPCKIQNVGGKELYDSIFRPKEEKPVQSSYPQFATEEPEVDKIVTLMSQEDLLAVENLKSVKEMLTTFTRYLPFQSLNKLIPAEGIVTTFLATDRFSSCDSIESVVEELEQEMLLTRYSEQLRVIRRFRTWSLVTRPPLRLAKYLASYTFFLMISLSEAHDGEYVDSQLWFRITLVVLFYVTIVAIVCVKTCLH